MAFVPNQLHIANGASTVDILIGGGSENFINSSGSLKLDVAQSLTLKAYDANFNVGGNFGVGNADGTQVYRLPNPNAQFPTQSQVMVFASDGTSTFETLAIPQNVAFNPAQANQNMAQYNVSNIAVLSVEKPVAAGQDQTKASLEVVANEAKFTSEAGIGGFTFDKPVSAPDMSSLTYSLEAVGAESSANAGEIATLQGQVSVLEQKVADLSAVILNLTGIVIP
jgi:hypothetical protein